MSNIKFSREELESIVQKLQDYFSNELDQELGQFEAEFLVDFFSKEMGSHYYNLGLLDARAIFESKIETIDEEIFSIQKDT